MEGKTEGGCEKVGKEADHPRLAGLKIIFLNESTGAEKSSINLKSNN